MCCRLDLDLKSFTGTAFRQLFYRNGVPDRSGLLSPLVISDNGTNFVGAKNELAGLLSDLDQNRIHDSPANRGIKWSFNPPSSPNFGGVFEIVFKSAKKAIAAILTNADVNDEELLTAFAGAEALINSRPLIYQAADPRGNVPLTPNHFLFGQVGGCFAPNVVDVQPFTVKKRWRRVQELVKQPFTVKKRWRRVQELVKHFWEQWMKEWLPMLHTRKKWRTSVTDVKEGDVVLVIQEGLSRGHWPLGRVLEVYPGKDNHVRVVKVQVGKICFVRPITKVCPLELH